MKLLLATQTTKAISLLLVRPLSVAIKKTGRKQKKKDVSAKALTIDEYRGHFIRQKTWLPFGFCQRRL
jgi:hypothetical protein